MKFNMKKKNFVVQHPSGMVAEVGAAALGEALASLGNLPRGERRRVLQSVNAALANVARRIERGDAGPKDLQGAADDIGIWFANEVQQGRVDLKTGRHSESDQPTAEQLAGFRKWHSRISVEDTVKEIYRRRALRAN